MIMFVFLFQESKLIILFGIYGSLATVDLQSVLPVDKMDSWIQISCTSIRHSHQTHVQMGWTAGLELNINSDVLYFM